eukprot:33657-Rhodomonas_salina.1
MAGVPVCSVCSNRHQYRTLHSGSLPRWSLIPRSVQRASGRKSEADRARPVPSTPQSTLPPTPLRFRPDLACNAPDASIHGEHLTTPHTINDLRHRRTKNAVPCEGVI